MGQPWGTCFLGLSCLMLFVKSLVTSFFTVFFPTRMPFSSLKPGKLGDLSYLLQENYEATAMACRGVQGGPDQDQLKSSIAQATLVSTEQLDNLDHNKVQCIAMPNLQNLSFFSYQIYHTHTHIYIYIYISTMSGIKAASVSCPDTS